MAIRILESEQHTSTDSLVRPLDTCHQKLVIARTHDCILQSASLYRREFPSVHVLFDLSGLAAGQFRWHAITRQCVIRYNPWVFAADFDHHLADTVTHEVAHYLVYRLHGSRHRPHGPEWKRVMIALGVTPKATGHYNLAGVPVRRQQRHTYRCVCRIHQISNTLHNRHHKGRHYVCKTCRSPLKFIGEPCN